MAINVVIEDPQLTVLGPPASLTLNVNSGEQGTRGTKIFSGVGNPNLSSLLSDKILGDLFVRTDFGPELGYLYQYVSVPGGPEWTPILSFGSVTASVNFFAQSASISAANAFFYANSSSTSFLDIDTKYLGAKSSAPLTDNFGNTLEIGALYFDTIFASLFVWDGSDWLDVTTSASATFQASLLIPKSILNNPGDIVIAQANDIPTIFPVGFDNYVLISDSSASVGLSWSNQFSTIAFTSSASANAASLALGYANAASANVDLRALGYASSASTNASNVALGYASSASANAANIASGLYLTKTSPQVTPQTVVDLRSASVMFTSASISGINLNSLPDVDTQGISKNQVLVYNGEKWNNENYIIPLFFGGM
jgi:hypothetical protein